MSRSATRHGYSEGPRSGRRPRATAAHPAERQRRQPEIGIDLQQRRSGPPDRRVAAPPAAPGRAGARSRRPGRSAAPGRVARAPACTPPTRRNGMPARPASPQTMPSACGRRHRPERRIAQPPLPRPRQPAHPAGPDQPPQRDQRQHAPPTPSTRAAQFGTSGESDHSTNELSDSRRTCRSNAASVSTHSTSASSGSAVPACNGPLSSRACR